MGNLFVKIGAVCCFVLAAGHLACLGFLNEAFVCYGLADTMNNLAAAYGGTWILYAITVLIALAFGVCGVYGLAAAGVEKLQWLPFIKLVIYAAAAVFLLRGCWGIVKLVADFTLLELISTLVSTGLGLLYLVGGINNAR